MSYTYGSVAIAAGSKALATDVGGDGTSCVVLGNESGYTVAIKFEGTTTSRTLYPGVVDLFDIPRGWNGNISFLPSPMLNNTAQWPSSFVQIDVFGLNERPAGASYPFSLYRASNIGNSVNTVGGTASSIANDNNAINTPVIEATPTGDGASTVQLSNVGVLVLGNNTHHGSISTDNGKIFSSGAGDLTVNGTSFLATTQVYGNLSMQAATTVSLDNGKITSSGTGNMTIQGTATANTVAFTTGSLTRISKFTAMLTTTPTFFNHGLGDTPDIILGIAQGVSVPTTRVWEYESATMTTTQVKMTGASAFQCDCIAIKF